ncbi:protein suppressor of sable-like [Ochlerotatus camptorhynchus]|uniref:protein suppressor of sable-like n=1 Tax=Ochlerotatus camptorhynchus TaxID=644619 RepID=UPI0031DE208E
MSEHEDLEDGEIEDDEEEEVIAKPVVIIETVPSISDPQPNDEDWDKGDKAQEISEKVQNVKNINDTKARLINELAPPKAPKRSKPAPVVDDWATSVETAIANALKKDGVQPPMPSISHRHDDNDDDRPSKRKRREKQKKKSGTEKPEELEEIDLEYEMMNVRGGSPRPTLGAGGSSQPDRSDSEDSYSSDDSRDRERERDRERRDRDRERDREYNRRKRKNRQRNRANRDNRKRKRDDSDDEKHHRNSGPRKMELCKFYLMDCCAKREKCLYMHSDFPCKYYYLGLKCKEKEKCLFSHGEPLSDELRAILMKHLETAPQEILGDFPRIGRESAANMVNATHRKLMEKYGMTNKTGPEGEAADGKIPSLLDMVGQGGKNRRSRWCDKSSGSTAGGKPTGNANAGEEFLSLKYLSGVISQDQIDNLERMGIHDLNQIMTLTVAQLNELGLSVTQIHELQLNALNMQKLRENIAKQNLQADDPEYGPEFGESTSAVSLGSSKDLDMRVTPSHTSLPTKETSNIPALGGQDVDMRFLPMINTGRHEATGGDNSNSQEDSLEIVSTSLTSLIKTPTVDYSQYLKDSNLNDDDDMDNTENAGNLLIANDDDDDDDDDDEENNLKISIEDEEQYDNGKYSSSKDQENANSTARALQPAVFDTKLVSRPLTTQKIDYTKPFGMYRAADDEPEKPSDSCILDRYGNDSEPTVKKKPDLLSRTSMYSNVNIPENTGDSSPSSHKQTDSPASTPTVGWTPTGGSTATATVGKPVPSSNKPARPSIYDDPYGSDDSGDSDSKSKASLYADRDKDMRLNFLSLDAKMGEDGNTDVDLRLPFKPIMTNYIPATEIDASITSHVPIVYKVHEVDVPKPNYKDIRRNTPRPERTKDPRLRRIFGMYTEGDSENNSKSDFLLTGLRSPKSVSSSLATVPVAPRVDPRTKRIQESKIQSPGHDSSGSSGTNNPNINPIQLDVQTILQRSIWYTDLSSKHKIMVNQQLAILTTEMKKYHNSDKSTDKLADFMHQLANNQMLQFILTNLNVYVDDSVSFCEVPLVPSQPPPLMSVPPPNLGMPPMGHIPPVNIPPPIQKPPSLFDLPRFNCPPEVRPGLLGVAPNMPFEQFLAMGQINKNNNPPPLLDEWVDDYNDGGGAGFVPNFERNNPSNFGNMRGNVMRNNNRQGGGNFRNNERWNNSGGGNNPNRRNNNNHRRMDKKK